MKCHHRSGLCRASAWLVLWLIFFGFASCRTSVYGPQTLPVEAITSVKAPPLKVHLSSGELLVLSRWTVVDSVLTGRGQHFDAYRARVPDFQFQIPLDSVALLETEVRQGDRPTAVVGMAVWSFVMGVSTIACVVDPKSCFGSCPTFYAESDEGPVLVAEGFSSSVLRVLEQQDLDALFHASAKGRKFKLLMRNEALETHAVRSLKLIAAEKRPGERVMSDRDKNMYTVTSIREAVTCAGPEGNCITEIARPDGIERSSPADSTDLSSNETVELAFRGGQGRQGIVLAARNSLMSTYLFYETLGFLGSQAAHIWADLERGTAEQASEALKIGDVIGRIDFHVFQDEAWKYVGSHEEKGPLATQFVLIPMSDVLENDQPVRIRMTSTKGAWRFDWVALADIGPAPPTVILNPTAVYGKNGRDESAYEVLVDPERHLITYPGDDYEIEFALPGSDAEWELFLSSTGYYYEWMRSEWVKDEDMYMAQLVRFNPQEALKVMAPGYKEAESRMDAEFWSSRFGR